MENIFRQSFVREAKTAVEKARDLASLDHQGMKGALREIIITKLFEPILPPEVRVATGKVVAHDGKKSAQIDLILYAPNILPPALYDEKNGFVAIEAALYTVEIKSKLNSTEIKKAINNAKSVRNLHIISTEHWFATEDIGRPIKTISTNTAYPINALFAFTSDLKGSRKTELDRYRELDPNADTHPAIQVICVAGKGYWYSKPGGGWRWAPPSQNLAEIMGFLGGLANTLPQLIAHKGRPRFGNYLATDLDLQDVI